MEGAGVGELASLSAVMESSKENIQRRKRSISAFSCSSPTASFLRGYGG